MTGVGVAYGTCDIVVGVGFEIDSYVQVGAAVGIDYVVV